MLNNRWMNATLLAAAVILAAPLTAHGAQRMVLGELFTEIG
jgi:hypothetical protein